MCAEYFQHNYSGPRCGLGELILPENEPGSSIMPVNRLFLLFVIVLVAPDVVLVNLFVTVMNGNTIIKPLFQSFSILFFREKSILPSVRL
jgi:aspartate ammonia-lyase